MASPALKKAQDEGVVLGLKKESTEPVLRLDVDVLLKQSPDTFNLFLLALVEMQKDANAGNNGPPKKQPKMGWYEIGGIHGLPTRDWDNVNFRNQQKPYGYCTHASVLFPFWHRPYMAMMEQSIYYNVVEIAERFNDKKRWREAARKFRMPYIDWFRPRKFDKDHAFVGIGQGSLTKFDWLFTMPRILTEKEVMVYKWDNESKLVKIQNPLYKYQFPKSIDDDLSGFLKKNRMSSFATTRQPTESIEASDVMAANNVLERSRESGIITLLNFFNLNTYSDYVRWSNFKAESGGGQGSVESLHNDYHDYLGGGGHIGDPRTAGFDPLFFLHHTNIDRIIALWQATHPTRWFPKKEDTPEKFGADDPLYPFRRYKDDGSLDWWTSNTSKKCEDFGYTYPELQKSSDPKTVFATIGANYLWSLQQRPPGFGPDPSDAMKPLELALSKVFDFGDGEKAGDLGEWKMASMQKSEEVKLSRTFMTREPASDISEVSFDEVKVPQGATAVRQWYVDSTVQKQALNGPFNIYFFVGGDDNIQIPYEEEPGLAGSSYIFTSSSDQCSNCAQHAEDGTLVSNTVPITPILLDYVRAGLLKSIEPEDVVPFLKTNLQIRIMDERKEAKDPRNVDGFSINVNTNVFYYQEGNPMPTEGPVNEYPELDGGLSAPAPST